MTVTNGRKGLLEQYGRFYGEEHFAIAFTAGVAGNDAKRVTTEGWNNSRPLADGDYAAGLVGGRGQQRNVAIVLRPSNLVVLECDSERDLVEIENLNLPRTLTVRSSEPYKRHFYFRPPAELGTIPYVAFRFESGSITADSGRYFLAPPSLHPSGVQYAFLPGLGPAETDIAELSEDTYLELITRAKEQASTQREQIRVDPEAKIQAGLRRETLFRFACMLRRWGRGYDAILAECLEFNQERCEPPVAPDLVEVQVKGAMKKEGDQELSPTKHPNPSLEAEETQAEPIVFETLRAFLQRDLPPNESLVGVTRNGTNLLPRYGWVMPWGREGSGKTSVLVDLIFHACTGIQWLQYVIGRPLRIVAIVNEGVPGGLQDKLEQKVEMWGHDKDAVLDNLAIYASPWGEFTFRNQQMVDHARSYITDFDADYVALDPLHTLGTTGAGTPVETEEFKHLLRNFGLWDNLGIITAHHSNKAGMLSGDWGRHPDTLFQLEKEGKQPATKMTLQKARPADPTELMVPCLLEWITESLGYRRVELAQGTPIDEQAVLVTVLQRLAKSDKPLALGPVLEGIEGGNDAKRTVVFKAIADGVIHNLAPPKKPGGRQTYRLTSINATEPVAVSGANASDDAQTTMVDTDNNADEALALTGLEPDHPENEKLTPNASLPVGEAAVSGVNSRGVTSPDEVIHSRVDDDIPF